MGKRSQLEREKTAATWPSRLLSLHVHGLGQEKPCYLEHAKIDRSREVTGSFHDRLLQ